MSLKNKKHKKPFVENEFQKISNSIKELNLDPSSVRKLKSIQKLIDMSTEKSSQKEKLRFYLLIFTPLLVFTLIYSGITTRQGFTRFWFWWKDVYDREDTYCTLSMPVFIQNALIPRFDCNLCSQIKNVSKVSNLSEQEFTERYAYTGVPVVITDAMDNWTAPHVFSFEFFKQIYPDDSPALDNYESSCQFFPYNTEFKNLRQVLNMNKERANLEANSAPWYIGWSNCDPSVANLLRKHYQRPYFLPKESEVTKMDWIFMGSPKYGAHMHLDHVGKPSWQAQVKGTKLWTLEPPPECYTKCQTLEVSVVSGEMIVLDTNQWYHKTLIVGQDISITIGSEYD